MRVVLSDSHSCTIMAGKKIKACHANNREGSGMSRDSYLNPAYCRMVQGFCVYMVAYGPRVKGKKPAKARLGVAEEQRD